MCEHADKICTNLERVSDKVLQEDCPAAAQELREWIVDFSEKLKCRLQEGLKAKLSFWSDLPYLALGMYIHSCTGALGSGESNL